MISQELDFFKFRVVRRKLTMDVYFSMLDRVGNLWAAILASLTAAEGLRCAQNDMRPRSPLSYPSPVG